MSSWLNILQGTQALRNIYGSLVPRLDAVSIHELRLLRDGPSLHLRFDLSEFPQTPPQKWRDQGFTTVQVTLAIDGISQLRLQDFGTLPVGSLQVQSLPEIRVKILFSSPQCSFEAIGAAGRIVTVSGYIDTQKS